MGKWRALAGFAQMLETLKFTEATHLHTGHNRFLKFLAVCLLLFNFYGFWFILGIHPTDPYSEGRRYKAAVKIAQGEHRFGIVPGDQTHYPNGPAYLLVPFIYFGLTDEMALRWIPAVIATVSETLLLYAFYKAPLSWIRKILLMLATAFLFHQPGIRHWVGALHEQSYNLSIAVLLAAFALLWRRKSWIYLLTGFIAAWIGYDSIPTQAVVLFGATFIAISMDEQDFTLAVKQSLQPLLWFFIGVLVAVGMHLGQNALYFQSFTKATADLFGSAGTRMGIDTRELNPDYYKHIQNVTPDTISRVSITVKMWKTFWRIFAWKRQIFVLILILAALAGYSIYADRRVRRRFVMNSLLIALLCFLSVGAWIWLMPLHAYHHVHFLPRHFFISLLLLIMGMLFLTFSKPEKDAMVVKNNP